MEKSQVLEHQTGNTVGPGQVPQGGRTRASAEPALRERAGALEGPGLTAGSAQPELWRMETRTGGFEGEDAGPSTRQNTAPQRPEATGRSQSRREVVLTGREREYLEGEEYGQRERRKGGENTDGDTETHIQRNPKAERDSKLCGGGGGGSWEKEPPKEAEAHGERKEEKLAAGRGPRGQGGGADRWKPSSCLKSPGNPSSRDSLAAAPLTHSHSPVVSPPAAGGAAVGLSLWRAGLRVRLNGRGSIWVNGGGGAAGLCSAPCCCPWVGHQCHPIHKRGLPEVQGAEAAALPVGLSHGQNEGPEPAQAGGEGTIKPGINLSPCLERLHSIGIYRALVCRGLSLVLRITPHKTKIPAPGGLAFYEGRFTPRSQPHHMFEAGKYCGGQNRAEKGGARSLGGQASRHPKG